MGTIHLIESLDDDAKKILNSLVQSVLLSSQENERNQLKMTK